MYVLFTKYSLWGMLPLVKVGIVSTFFPLFISIILLIFFTPLY
nr:MAG TPA: hypothetical protein [Caudoviricetes sp.]